MIFHDTVFFFYDLFISYHYYALLSYARFTLTQSKTDTCNAEICAAPPSPCHTFTHCSITQCVYGYANGRVCDDSDPTTILDQCMNGTCVGKVLCDVGACGCDDATNPTQITCDALGQWHADILLHHRAYFGI